MKEQDLVAKPKTAEEVAQALTSGRYNALQLPNGQQFFTQPAYAFNAAHKIITTYRGPNSRDVIKIVSDLQGVPYYVEVKDHPELTGIIDEDRALRCELGLPDSSKDTVLKKLLKYVKAHDCEEAYYKNELKNMIKMCRECDRDYPELKFIEKSLWGKK